MLCATLVFSLCGTLSVSVWLRFADSRAAKGQEVTHRLFRMVTEAVGIALLVLLAGCGSLAWALRQALRRVYRGRGGTSAAGRVSVGYAGVAKRLFGVSLLIILAYLAWASHTMLGDHTAFEKGVAGGEGGGEGGLCEMTRYTPWWRLVPTRLLVWGAGLSVNGGDIGWAPPGGRPTVEIVLGRGGRRATLHVTCQNGRRPFYRPHWATHSPRAELLALFTGQNNLTGRGTPPGDSNSATRGTGATPAVNATAARLARDFMPLFDGLVAASSSRAPYSYPMSSMSDALQQHWFGGDHGLVP